MSQKWEYNGIELEIDLEDAEFAKKYEDAFQKVAETEKRLQKTGKNSEIILGYCDMFYGLFDDLYGPGTGDKLFGGKKNTRMCDEAYAVFLDAVKTEVDAITQRRGSQISKYRVSQYGNRQGHPNRNQHRYQNRNGGKH